MNQQSPQQFKFNNPWKASEVAGNRLPPFRDRREFPSSCWLKLTLSLLGGLSLLSSGLIWTQTKATADDAVIPETSAAPPAAPAPAPAPPVSISQPAPPAAPIQAAPIQKTTPKVRLSAPKISIPPGAPTRAKQAQPQPSARQTRKATTTAKAGKNSFIDTTNYTQEAKDTYTGPSAVVLTERSTGCQTISQQGNLSRGNCGNSAQKPSTLAKARIAPPPQRQVAQPYLTSHTLAPVRRKTSLNRDNLVQNHYVSLAVASLAQATGGNRLSLALEPIPPYNRATSMGTSVPIQANRTSLIFPLPMPASITSAFGWRLHPITGTERMHQGTDIAAPLGTPVLASYPGEVAVADWQGGYGLMVTILHEEGTQESRYAHLSEIYVKPGEWVEQGTVIGRVGSTGFSTGPHLHFEWRHLTNQGWVAVDAGLHLEYALDNLVRSLQLAQAQPQ